MPHGNGAQRLIAKRGGGEVMTIGTPGGQSGT